jgi:hypothetical protein
MTSTEAFQDTLRKRRPVSLAHDCTSLIRPTPGQSRCRVRLQFTEVSRHVASGGRGSSGKQQQQAAEGSGVKSLRCPPLRGRRRWQATMTMVLRRAASSVAPVQLSSEDLCRVEVRLALEHRVWSTASACVAQGFAEGWMSCGKVSIRHGSKNDIQPPDIVLDITQLLGMCVARNTISLCRVSIHGRYPGPPEWSDIDLGPCRIHGT